MHIQLLRNPAVRDRVGLSRSEIHRLVSLGKFPPSIALGDRIRAWDSNEIDAWIQARIAGKADDEIRELITRLVQARSEYAS